MTTPNEELIAELQQLANEIEISYRIEVIEEAAEALQSQAERIAELERESETHAKAYGLAIVERDNLRHELKTAQEGWRCECSTDDACRFARERDALRAQLAEIAATEPESLATDQTDEFGEVIYREVFTRPMPAQDVTELVKDAERWRFTMWWQDQNPRPESIQNCLTDMHRWARARGALGPNSEELQRAVDAALSKYKGAK